MAAIVRVKRISEAIAEATEACDARRTVGRNRFILPSEHAVAQCASLVASYALSPSFRGRRRRNPESRILKRRIEAKAALDSGFAQERAPE